MTCKTTVKKSSKGIMTGIQEDLYRMTFKRKVGKNHTKVYLRAEGFRQGGDLLLEEILGLLPDAGILPVLELEQAGKQSLAELLGTLTGQERWQVVDTDHTQGRTLRASRQGDRYRRLVKGSCDVVHGDRVVGVRALQCLC